MDCSMPAFPVPHHLLEFAQVHVHWISGAIQSIWGNQPSILIGRTDVKAEASILWPPEVKSQLIGKTDAGKDWRQRGEGDREWDGWMASQVTVVLYSWHLWGFTLSSRKTHLLVSRREGWLPSAFQNPLQAALNRIEEVANESSNSDDLRWPLCICLWLDLTWGIHTHDLARRFYFIITSSPGFRITQLSCHHLIVWFPKETPIFTLFYFGEEISPTHEIDIIVISNRDINWFQKTLAPKIITKEHIKFIK